MTLYPGTRSLDAEIILNLIEGTVTMDYTLNKFGSPYQSNDSVVLKSEWREVPILTKIKHCLFGIPFFVTFFFILPFQPILTTLVEYGFIKSPKIQYYYQDLLKFCIEQSTGIFQESQSGDLKGSILKFNIPSNLWFSYELSGEYQEKIKSISFLRNFITRKRFGKFDVERQYGWNVVFEFTDPPQNGSATITYV